jgi:hypothetical protein
MVCMDRCVWIGHQITRKTLTKGGVRGVFESLESEEVNVGRLSKIEGFNFPTLPTVHSFAGDSTRPFMLFSRSSQRDATLFSRGGALATRCVFFIFILAVPTVPSVLRVKLLKLLMDGDKPPSLAVLICHPFTLPPVMTCVSCV